MTVALATADKVRRGNPGKHALNKKEPQPPKPPKTLPDYPDHMPTEGRAVWYEVGSHLLEYGFITTTDTRALVDYVELDILNRALSIEMRGQPPVVGEGEGATKKNPLWMLKLEYLRERRAQHIQFGMTPSARSKIISTLQDEDPLETALQ